ncbi:peptidoglycan-binding domain-containing protein [Streptomyces sp. NPDC093105]
MAPPTASATPSPTDAPEGATLSLGDTGPEVEELQTRLRLLWVYLEDADGVFDEGLRAALIQYQSRFWQLEDPEGVYGPDTRRKLERETKNSYR